ncbi:MAG TPA: hypothetical protein VK588_07865 [Chitinophagaceae bacterium]|nr:hypothetical protein [Chitinophagaceae bacterium]
MKKITLTFFSLIFGLLVFAQQYSGKAALSPNEKLNDKYCSGLFKSCDGTIIDLSQDNRSASGYLNILNYLNGHVAGLQIYYARDKTPVPFIRNQKASIFVDETPVDAGYLKDLQVDDIAMVKIIKGPFAGAVGNGGGGVIAIYTIKGDDEGDDSDE